jgi:predicted acetyltransferase
MSVEIRVCPEGRFAELIRTAEVAFGEDLPDDLIGRVERVADPERFFGALDGDRFVGTSGVFTQRLSVPGGDVAAGGITFVVVLPSHRRRGLMSSMMRLMIDDCHSRGEPIAMLWAAEAAIYQRFGFGLATYSVNLEAETRSTGFAREWRRDGTFRLIPAGEGRELVAPIYEVARSQRAGFLARSGNWWEGVLPNPEKDKKGGEARRLVVYETSRGPEAYAVYKTKAEWNVRGPNSTLIVEEALGASSQGTREIWRYLFDVDLIRTLKAWRMPLDHPVFSLVAEPRRLGATIGDGLWLRIVDVAASLEARTYGIGGTASGSLTFELTDSYCPWNAGTWRLDVYGGKARVSRAAGRSQIYLDANDLGAMYLGGVSAAALAAAGRVTEVEPGGLGAADALFAAALQPWCPQEF